MKYGYSTLCSIIFSLFTLILCQYPLSSYAHEGHAHPLEKQEIIDKASKIIDMAIEQQKLAPSWKDAKMVEAKMLEEKGGQWLIQYNNPRASDGNKDLFIFFSLDGKYIAMNHTGK
jgi:hypothetical protein